LRRHSIDPGALLFRDQMVAVLLAQVERIGNTPLLLPSTESTLANFTVCWTGKSPGFSPLTVDPA